MSEDTDSNDAAKKTDYEVGYRKPPKHTRFRKGSSGNPKGRPKGSRNFKTILREALNKPVAIRENGRTRIVSRHEALVETTLVRALGGDHRALHELLPRICELPEEESASGDGSESLSRDEAEILTSIRERLLRSVEPVGRESNESSTTNDAEGEEQKEGKT